jgi:hypothetical protein
MPTTAAAGLTKMSLAECLARLASVATGRMAVTHKALPCLVPVCIGPVHFGLVKNEIMVRACLGNLVPLVPGVVALEVGTLGDGKQAEWTVGVRGFLTGPRAEVVPAAKEPPGASPEMFRLSLELVTGWTHARVASPPQLSHGAEREEGAEHDENATMDKERL